MKKTTRPARKPAQPHTRARERKRKEVATLRGKAAFLKEFAQSGNILQAARKVGVGRRTVYTWLESDIHFKRLFDEAHEDALDALEEEARRRAVDGVLEPVYQGGEKVGTIRKYSDALLTLLLKGKRPDTFRERHEVTGKNGGPLQSQTDVFHKAKSTLIDKLSRLSARAAAAEGDAS